MTPTAGRPKGARNKLSEAFIEALHDDFLEHGVSVISRVREDKPEQYLKVIASIKTTAVLRDAILKAAENAGDGDLTVYLTECAKADRRSFLTLLAKVLPTQVDGELQHAFLSHEDALAELE